MSSRLLKKYEKNVTVQSLHLLVSIFMKTRSLVVPPYADLDEKVLMQASLHKHFLIQTSAWLNCNKKYPVVSE